MANKIRNYIIHRPNETSIKYALMTPYKLSGDLEMTLETMTAKDLETIYTRYPKARNYPIVDFEEWNTSRKYL